jgi:hypothetical protein
VLSRAFDAVKPEQHRFKYGATGVQVVEDVLGVGSLRRCEDVLRAE